VPVNTHTPGPWIVRDHPTQDIYIGPTNDGGAPSVAIVPRRISRTPGEHNANARLIAAAPELLEALTRLLPYANFMLSCTVDDDDAAYAAVDRARAAVAKATGSAA